jgi:hypothetical protein
MARTVAAVIKNRLPTPSAHPFAVDLPEGAWAVR